MEDKLFWKRFGELSKAIKENRQLSPSVFTDVFLCRTKDGYFHFSRNRLPNDVVIAQVQLKEGDVLPQYFSYWSKSLGEAIKDITRDAKHELRDAERGLRTHYTLLGVREFLEKVKI